MEQPQYCLVRIQSYYPDLSETEKRIADYILQFPEKMMHQSITQVAEDIGVATSTVFRFCKRIGFKGYQTMKLAIAAEIASPIREMVEEKIQEQDHERAITEKIFNTSIRTFKDTIQMMDFASLKKAVNLILDAERVEFYGLGASGIVALDAHHKFIASGISTVAYTDPYLQLRAASQLGCKDTVVIISTDGGGEDVIRLLKTVKETGANIIAITSFKKSPLSQKADLVLNTVSSDREKQMDDTFSRIVQLSLIDSIYMNVINAQKTAGKNTIEKIKNFFQ
jgi:DNA-binding MurR/RpiR family transcriptional regulator